jgi:radical SAM protein with 4Fe4S-binding SPASM domain
MTIREKTYGDFSKALHDRVQDHRVPLVGSFELTRRCSLRCVHCYNNLPMGDPVARQQELTTAEVCDVLDQIAEAGCLHLLFTGGEILARADFLEIYRHAKAKGFLLTLFTNGTMITPRAIEVLVEQPPFSIEITLYGATRETYEKVTGIPGSYDRCLRGVEAILQFGLPLKLKTVGLTSNRHELEQMQRFAAERAVLFKFDAMLNPRLDCSLSPLNSRLQPHEVVALDLSDGRRMTEMDQFAARFVGVQPTGAAEGQLYHCGGGVRAFAIDPYGRLSICLMSETETYDLRSGRFIDGWTGHLLGVRRKPRTRVTKCTFCQLKSLCGMCPALAMLEAGDPEQPLDFYCQVAHLRAYAFHYELAAHGDCEYCHGGEREQDLRRTCARHLSPLVGQRGAAAEGKAGNPADCGGGCSCG